MLYHPGQVAHKPARVQALSAPATWIVSLAWYHEADRYMSQHMLNDFVAEIVEPAREILPDTQGPSHHQLERSTMVMICSAVAKEVTACKAKLLGSYEHLSGAPVVLITCQHVDDDPESITCCTLHKHTPLGSSRDMELSAPFMKLPEVEH